MTDENDSESTVRIEDNGLIYLDNNLYKEISAGKYLDLKYSVDKYNIEMSDLTDATEIDFTNNDLQQIVENGDYDLLREDIDAAFNAEQHAESVRANIITATTATFTVGLVTYLLRAGSLVASMMSTLPLWRGFDPIVIAAGKKKKADDSDAAKSIETESETLFDGEAE